MDKKDLVLVFAMAQESQEVFRDYEVLHTGIGKVNATYALTDYLARNTPKMVVNMGTAGALSGDFFRKVVNPVAFVQRDMDVTFLGFEKYQTPFSTDPVTIEYGMRVDGLPQVVCGTGDNFATGGHDASFDVVDMEAYALALICQRKQVPFLCLKYISDGANGDSGKDFNEALHDTAETLRETLRGITL